MFLYYNMLYQVFFTIYHVLRLYLGYVLPCFFTIPCSTKFFLLYTMFYHVIGLYSDGYYDGCTGQGRHGRLHQDPVYVLV